MQPRREQREEKSQPEEAPAAGAHPGESPRRGARLPALAARAPPVTPGRSRARWRRGAGPGRQRPPRPRAAGAGDRLRRGARSRARPGSGRAGRSPVSRPVRERRAVRSVVLKKDGVDCAPGRWSRARPPGTEGRGSGWGQRAGNGGCVAAPSNGPFSSPVSLRLSLWARGEGLLCSRLLCQGPSPAHFGHLGDRGSLTCAGLRRTSALGTRQPGPDFGGIDRAAA